MMNGKDALFVQQLATIFDHVERQVICLHYVEDLSPCEIGLVLGIPTHNVEDTLHQAQVRTREAMGQQSLAGTAA